jgi:hypothetical protein
MKKESKIILPGSCWFQLLGEIKMSSSGYYIVPIELVERIDSKIFHFKIKEFIESYSEEKEGDFLIKRELVFDFKIKLKKQNTTDFMKAFFIKMCLEIIEIIELNNLKTEALHPF